MGSGGAENNVNKVSKVEKVWVQTFVFLKDVFLFYYPTVF